MSLRLVWFQLYSVEFESNGSVAKLGWLRDESSLQWFSVPCKVTSSSQCNASTNVRLKLMTSSNVSSQFKILWRGAGNHTVFGDLMESTMTKTCTFQGLSDLRSLIIIGSKAPSSKQTISPLRTDFTVVGIVQEADHCTFLPQLPRKWLDSTRTRLSRCNLETSVTQPITQPEHCISAPSSSCHVKIRAFSPTMHRMISWKSVIHDLV
jgi:hypothetical protein